MRHTPGLESSPPARDTFAVAGGASRFRLRTAAATLAAVALVAPAAHAAVPETIPALQKWSPSGAGRWTPAPRPRIVVRHRDRRALRGEARQLAADLGHATVTARRHARARRGDIVIGSTPATGQLGAEGYRLRVGKAFSILAPTTAGAYYGARTLLQLLRSKQAIPTGRAVDWPRYPERGVMVDAGRKYYTPGWIEQLIREMGDLKLNYLHLHLSDKQGFRIETRSHPEILSDKYLTAADVRAILAEAARDHVMVVPEIDMPGHMGWALAKHPEFQLQSDDGQRNPAVLDVTNPAAVAFARDLVTDVLDLFPGPYYHQGGDEVLNASEFPVYQSRLARYAQQRYGPQANAADALHGFENDIAKLAASRGRTPRMWSDDLKGGSAVALTPRVVEWWTEFSPASTQPAAPTPQEIVAAGHQLVNAGWFPTYFVNGVGGSNVQVTPDLKAAYERWSVDRFAGVAGQLNPDAGVTVPTPPPVLRGSILHLWNDNPAFSTEAQDTPFIAPGLRVMSQKTWDSPRLVNDYASFQALAARLGSAP